MSPIITYREPVQSTRTARLQRAALIRNAHASLQSQPVRTVALAWLAYEASALLCAAIVGIASAVNFLPL